MTPSPSTQRAPGGWLTKERHREALAGYLFILPTFIGYTVFIVGPILAAIGISLTDFDLFEPARFIGFQNYVDLLADQRLHNVGVGLLLAVLINRHMPSFVRYLFRTAYFFPVLVALAYSAIIWQYLYQKDTGIINYYLHFLNIEPIPWLSSPLWVMPSIIIMDVWKNTGFAMLVFLAGLQGISQDYYESAALDGANRWQSFRHVTLPLITPTLFFNVIIFMIGALQVFDSIVVLTQGGPGDSSRSLVMYVYEKAFQVFEMGYASAISITLFIVIMLLTLIQFRAGQSCVHYE
jgi:multiple sugar transport system permease protein